MNSLLVFDIDDTLYLERDYVRSGFNALEDEIARRFDVCGFSTLCWSMFLDGVRGNTFQLALEKLGLKNEISVIPELVTLYRTHIPAIKLLEDARSMLENMLDYANIAILTDGPAASQKAKAKALGLENLTDEIIYTSERGCPKPSPEGFLYLMQKFDCKPENCAYFGDNPAKDFTGPHELGWKTYRLKRPLSLHEDKPSPDYITAEWPEFSSEALNLPFIDIHNESEFYDI